LTREIPGRAANASALRWSTRGRNGRTEHALSGEGSGKATSPRLADAAGARRHRRTPHRGHVPQSSDRPLVVEDLRAAAFDERALFHLLNLARGTSRS